MDLNLGMSEVQLNSITFPPEGHWKVSRGANLGGYWTEAKDATHSEMDRSAS